jgi:hypothetical protein
VRVERCWRENKLLNRSRGLGVAARTCSYNAPLCPVGFRPLSPNHASLSVDYGDKIITLIGLAAFLNACSRSVHRIRHVETIPQSAQRL